MISYEPLFAHVQIQWKQQSPNYQNMMYFSLLNTRYVISLIS